MSESKHKFYIASPFFNDEQIEEVSNIEKFCYGCGYEYFSPRFSQSTDYIKRNITEDSWEFELSKKFFFKDDIDALDDCDAIIVNPNNLDSGTLFELGYALGTNMQIYPSHQKYSKLVQDLVLSIKRLDTRTITKATIINCIDEYKYVINATEGVDNQVKYIIAENGNNYKGFSKVLLGYLYSLGYLCVYLDSPRKSNIMLTSSGIVYETTDMDSVKDFCRRSNTEDIISHIEKQTRVIGRIDD